MFALLISFCLSGAAHAQTPETIDRLNKSVHEMQGPSVPCADCAAAVDTDKEPAWRQCVQQLCPEVKIPTTSDVEKYINAREEPEFKAAKADMLKAIQSEAEDDAQALDFLARQLDQHPILKDPSAKAIYQMVAVNKNMALIETDGNSNLDEQKSRRAILAAGGTENDFRATAALYKIYVEADAGGPAILNQSASEAASTRNPEQVKKELRDSLNEALVEANKEQDALKLPPGSIETADSFPVKEFRRKIEAEEMTDADFAKLKTMLTNYRYLNRARADKGFLATIPKEASDLRKLLPKDIQSVITARIAQDLKFAAGELPEASASEFQALLQSRIDDCSQTLLLSYVQSPTTKQIEDFKTHEKEIREKYLKSVSRFLSAHSSQALGEDAKNWRLRTAPDRSGYLKQYRALMTDYQSKTRTTTDDLKKASGAIAERIAATALAYYDPENAVTDVRDLCRDKVPKASGDQTMVNDKGFFMSADTISHSPDRDEAITHEYSHLVSNFAQSNPDISKETMAWYRKSRACMNEQRGDKKVFEEEDFANALSGASQIAPSQTCFFDFTDDTSFVFSLKDQDYDKSHPSALYNLLAGNSSAGIPTPAICTQTLLSKGETGIPGNCIGTGVAK